MSDIGPRETIFQGLETIMGDVEGQALVTRDLGILLSGQITEHPAIFIVDLGDEVDDTDNYEDNRRTLRFAMVAVIEGSTRAAAPNEMAQFIWQIRKQLYEQILDCSEVDRFAETGMSHLSFSEVNSKEVHQGIQGEIKYIENITNILSS